ncbi:ABC transporter permease [Dactylosporangium sp. CA-233914]|uniref:ABC transporter permease n=1 Tax=Dactylosporangium sp. CA-233914 TaxID=3239934 RepID=UPI003D8FA9C4
MTTQQASIQPAIARAPAAPPGRAMRILRLARSSVGGTTAALVIIWIGLALAAPNFATVSNLLNIFLAASTLAIIAGGLTLALIAGEIDLSLGSVEALAGSLAAVLIVSWHLPWPLALVVGVLAGAAVGGVNAFFATRMGVPSFVASLAMLGVAGGAAYLLTQGTSVFGLGPQFGAIGQGTVLGIPVPVLIAVTVLAVLAVLLHRTTFGLNIYAVGGNAEAARLSGVNVRRTKAAALVLSGGLAGVAGIILASRLDAGSGTVGSADLMAAVAAVVIGGTSLNGGVGSIAGTVVGAVLIASIQNGLVLLNVTAFWQQVAIGSLILVAALLDRLSKIRTRGVTA